jgi:hypothetical protein
LRGGQNDSDVGGGDVVEGHRTDRIIGNVTRVQLLVLMPGLRRSG